MKMMHAFVDIGDKTMCSRCGNEVLRVDEVCPSVSDGEMYKALWARPMVEGIARKLAALCNGVKHDDARVWTQYINDAGAIAEMVDAHCFKLAAAVCEHRAGDDHGNPFCLMSQQPIR